LAGAERVAYLDEACAADPKLREHVGTLVAAAQRSASPRRQDTSGVVTQTLTSASAIAPGRRIGHYEIVSKLGEGGMGAVYRAVDTNLGRQVALKVISRASISDEDKRRFAREAKSASALNHPNVVTVYEYSAEAGLDFIVMELVEGAPLNEILKRGETPLSTLLDYARQVAAALTKAHGAGIVHRDLKPGNIMITPDGVAKVLDFGLAKRSQGPEGPDGETMTAVTQAGIVMGTPAYMSPEQVLGEAADHSTDIFAFGVILYEMVCGQRPFKGEDTAATLRQILHKEPPPPPDTAPEAVKALIGKCLQKSRQHRLRSMAEAVALLSSSGPLRLPVSRSRGRVAALAGGLVVLGIAGSLLWCAAGRRAPAAHSVATTYPTASTHPTATASVGLDSVDGTSSELTIRARGLLRRYDKTGYLDRAIRLLESALEKDAKFAAAYATISEAYLRKGHSVTSADNHWLKLARDSAAQAVSLNPDLAEAHTSLGEVLLEGGETDRAKGEIDRALQLDPLSSRACLAMAKLQAKLDAVSAETLYGKAAALAPDDWIPHSEHGGFLYRAARYRDAAAEWEEAARLAPDNVFILKTAVRVCG
jgi:Tfp pilus assembly protein PilF/predicted Ser/Thr protein kinase